MTNEEILEGCKLIWKVSKSPVQWHDRLFYSYKLQLPYRWAYQIPVYVKLLREIKSIRTTTLSSTRFNESTNEGCVLYNSYSKMISEDRPLAAFEILVTAAEWLQKQTQ